jgi:hypothetical protein
VRRQRPRRRRFGFGVPASRQFPLAAQHHTTAPTSIGAFAVTVCAIAFVPTCAALSRISNISRRDLLTNLWRSIRATPEISRAH